MSLREVVAFGQIHHRKVAVDGFHSIVAEACPSKAFGGDAHIVGCLKHLGACFRRHCCHHAILELIDVALQQSQFAAFL